MKLLILSVILASLSLQAQAQTQRTTLQWSCAAVEYPDAKDFHQFPVAAEIQVQISGDADNPSFSFSPDIFEGKKGIASFFRRSSTPKLFIESRECIQDFENKFSAWAADKAKIADAFSQQLAQKEYVKGALSPQSDKLPRFYAGHSFHASGPSEYRSELANFCQGGSANPVTITSKDFLQYVKNVAANPMTNIEESCLKKVDQFNKEHRFAADCSAAGKVCSQVRQDAQTYEQDFTDLKDGRIAALELEKEQKDSWSSFRMANGAQAVLVGKVFENARTYPWGGCAFDFTIQEDGKHSSIMFYDNAIAQAMPYIRENMDVRCKRHILKNYLLNKFINDDPLKSGFCKSNPCENIKEAKKLFEQNVQDLLVDIVGEDTAQIACFTDDSYGSKGDQVEDFLRELEEISACSEVKPGQSKVVSATVTGVSANYLLERIDDKNYKATVAVDFEDGRPGTKVHAQEMFDRVKSCIDVASTYFRSPSGESMQVEILAPDDIKKLAPSKRPVSATIDIMPRGHRSNSRAYEENIDCGTITHEVLHLMGLVDEYEEKWDFIYVDTETGKIVNGSKSEMENLRSQGRVELRKSYECRATPDVESVMANHHNLFDRVVASSVQCKCQNERCRSVMAEDSDKKLKELFTGDLWTRVWYRDRICSYQKVRNVTVFNSADVHDLPMHKVLQDKDGRIVFEHTEMQAAKGGASALGYATVYRYSCGDCQDDNTCQALNTLKSRVRSKGLERFLGCPLGAKKVGGGELKYNEAVEQDFQFEDDVFTMSSVAPTPDLSLLRPAHFARLKHGGCSSKVKNYTACARYAYVNLYPEDCPDRPKFCEDTKQWLLSED